MKSVLILKSNRKTISSVIILLIMLTFAFTSCSNFSPAQNISKSDNNTLAVSPDIESSQSSKPAQSPDETQTPNTETSEINNEPPEPVLYENNGQVYLTSGFNTVCLGNLKLVETDGYYGNNFNGIITDNSIIYYLSNVDEVTGAGDLMCINMRESLTSQLIANDVRSVVASQDGTKVMYLKNEVNGIGDLYLRETAGSEEEICDNVIVGDPEFSGGGYGFSENGEYIYFIEQKGIEKDKTYTLYTQGKGQQSNIVLETMGNSDETFARLLIANNGDMVFSMWVNNEAILYLYSQGNIELMSINETDDFIQASFEDVNDFLFLQGNLLFYKSPGRNPVELSEKCIDVRFDQPYWITEADKKDFLLSEKSDDGTIELYEETTDGNKIYLTKDAHSAFTNNDATCVTFTLYDGLYVMKKIDNVWGDKQFVSEGTLWERFDPAGRYMYFLENAYETDPDTWDSGWSGDLCRYRISDDKKEVLLKHASSLNFIGNEAYAITDEGVAYRIIGPNQKEKVSENVSEIWGDSSGIYVMTTSEDYKYSISFITKAGEKGTICTKANQILSFNGYIE